MIHGPLLDVLTEQFRHMWASRRPRLLIEYDFPNINRAFARFRLHKNNFVEELSGGFLTPGFIEPHASFGARSIDDVLHLDEFTRHESRAYYGSAMLGRRPLQLVNPLSYVSPALAYGDVS
jgi:hypothetical protein